MSNNKLLVLVCLFTISVTLSPVLLADGKALRMMAEITLNLNHYPSDAEKDALKAMINSGSINNAEKVIATAMINLQHKASGSDKSALMKVMNDGSVDSNTKTLATIIHNLSHMPSSSDKKKLQSLLK